MIHCSGSERVLQEAMLMPTVNHRNVTHTVRLSELIQELLKSGHTPRQVRLELQRRGIRWAYNYDRKTPGSRERAKNLRRIGQKPCGMCGAGIPLKGSADACEPCLTEKWTGIRPLAGELSV